MLETKINAKVQSRNQNSIRLNTALCICCGLDAKYSSIIVSYGAAASNYIGAEPVASKGTSRTLEATAACSRLMN